MSEWAQVFIAIIGALVALGTLAGAAFQAWIGYKMAGLKQAADDAKAAAKETAVKVKEVKVTLEATQAVTEKGLLDAAAKRDETLKVVNQIHTLTNSNMGAALKLTAELSRWKANQTHDAGDIEAAVLAEKNLKEHQASQKIVDEGKKIA